MCSDQRSGCGSVYLLSSVSPISAFGWEVFSDGLAWGMDRKRIVWLRHARMLVCGEVFQGLPTVFRYAMASAARFSCVFDTPALSSVCKGSRLVSSCPICVEWDCAVSLSLAAARRVVPRLGCLEAGERWWFENSRAYLYYFFIVNDCQFIVRSFASGREALKDGEVFVRCAFPYKAIVNFLVFESHMLAFCKVFLWRVRFWLRMNAGGVLNTCKSNGIHQALLGGESGERVSNA